MDKPFIREAGEASEIASPEKGMSRRELLGSTLAVALAGLTSRLATAGGLDEVPNQEGHLQDMDESIEEGIEVGMDALLDRWMSFFRDAEAELIDGMRTDMRVALREIYAEYHADFRYRIIQFHFRDNPLFRGGTVADYRREGFELMERILRENSILIDLVNNILADPGNIFFGVEPQTTLKDRLDRIRRMPSASQIEALSALTDELKQLIVAGPDGSPGSGDEQPELISDFLYIQALLDRTIKDQVSRSGATPAVDSERGKIDEDEDVHGDPILLEDRVPAINVDPDAFKNPGALLGPAQEDLWVAVARLLLAQVLHARIRHMGTARGNMLHCEVPLHSSSESVPIMPVFSIDRDVRLGLQDGQGFRRGFDHWLKEKLPSYVDYVFREAIGEKPEPAVREKLNRFHKMHPLVSFAGEVMADSHLYSSNNLDWYATYGNKPRWYVEDSSTGYVPPNPYFGLDELLAIKRFISFLKFDRAIPDNRRWKWAAYCPPEMRSPTVDDPFQFDRHECGGTPFFPRDGLKRWFVLPDESELQTFLSRYGTPNPLILHGHALVSQYDYDPLRLLDAIYNLDRGGAFRYSINDLPRMTSVVVESSHTVARQLMPYTYNRGEVSQFRLKHPLKFDDAFTRWVTGCPIDTRKCSTAELRLGEQPVFIGDVLDYYANLPWRAVLRPLAAAASSLGTPAR